MLKIVTYFAFTLLSVLIQFGLMDYIQANLQIQEKTKDLNFTSQKKRFSDILRDFSQKPHALYYQTKDAKVAKNEMQISIVTNTTPELASENPTTIYDVLLYDENTTITQSTIFSEESYTTTEFENVTEITIFKKKNTTTVKTPTTTNKKNNQENCYCNLLYQLCDINCCCDEDCSENETKIFNCTEKGMKSNLHIGNIFCSVDSEHSPWLNGIDNFFCVAKTNLPEKRNTNYKKYNTLEVNAITEQALKWRERSRAEVPLLFSPKVYSIGDPIWLMSNGSIFHTDLPSSKVNNYCDERTPIYFLKDQTVYCNVMIRDLEMFNILRNINETRVVSVPDVFRSFNNSALNCTNLQCTNWTIKVCNEASCTNYDNNLHEATCTDIECVNMALHIEYIFYYHDFNITKAILYLHTQNVSLKVPLLKQVISVKFYLASNESLGKIVQLSGNPSYVKGLPVIASYESGNYTSNFFSNDSKLPSLLKYPENKNGICTLTNITKRIVTFGTNKRSKCRYVPSKKLPIKDVTTCEKFNDNVKNILGISRRIVIAPLGNPKELKDEDWIDLQVDMPHQVYGEVNKDSTLTCYNTISKLSLVFGYADVSDITDKGKIKILYAKAAVAMQNLTFTDESVSAIITVETSFVDLTKTPVYEYAGSPQLNIHLPKDFFFPFPSNSVYRNIHCNVLMLLMCIVCILILK